jgi:hypothetical protein
MDDLVSALATAHADVATVGRALGRQQALLDSLLERLAAGLVQQPRHDDRRVQQTLAIERRSGRDRRRCG